MSYADTLTPEQAFRRYEEIRHRLPAARFPGRPVECSGLLDIADQFDAFVLDSFGVLNVGDRAIAGAPDCLSRLRDMGKRLVVLTNAASYTRAEAIGKYERLGFDFDPSEVVSSRDVAAKRLARILPNGHWGAVAAPEDQFSDFDANVSHWGQGNVDGLLLLSSAALSPELFRDLEATLRDKPMPIVVANPDLVAPRENGLSKEPGYYAHLLTDSTRCQPMFFGKPFEDAFADAFAQLEGIPPNRIAMVGDTLHTDILGGRAADARTVLVRAHGLFAGLDVSAFVTRSAIVPDFWCDSI